MFTQVNYLCFSKTAKLYKMKNATSDLFLVYASVCGPDTFFLHAIYHRILF